MSDPNPALSLSLPIEGMSCASCVGRVETALRRVEGVASVAVNLAVDAHLKLTRAARLKLTHPL